ncbi:ribokinase [Microbacterium pseudoresistens]|uniref:Deoxyribokinase n=1 Tax=Microbacterium pseudoresistens TaxID=640634 RepID=A0A7Y9JMF8_9MICO|nr:ribokinase [Microbacterium pseudoresistens]
MDSLPQPGETVVAHAVTRGLGGKGANQAVAAARSGARSEMVGFVGDDSKASELLAWLNEFGVSTPGLITVDDAESGVAAVVRDAAGANQIIVSPGASSIGEISDAALRAAIGRARILVLQGEIPVSLSRRAATIAHASGVRTLINLAPVVDFGEALRNADPLIVNEIEARQLLALEGPHDDLTLASLLSETARSVVVTIGDRGAMLATTEGTIHVPAPRPERVVDTTGAGDAFVGALAARLAFGADLESSVRFAVAAATMSVESAGAAASYPLFEEVLR